MIFNQTEFDDPNLSSREGSDKDCEDIQKLFGDFFGFDTIVLKNGNFRKINETCLDVLKRDHTSSDCLMVFILTHGSGQLLMAKDVGFTIEQIQSYFNSKSSK